MARFRRTHNWPTWRTPNPLHTYFDQETYNFCLKNLGNNKAPGQDKIPNSILKNMSSRFHKLLFLFFKHCYKQKQIPASWKTSLTVLLYKKGDPSQLTNHRPIALANTIYKLYTNTLTSILPLMGKDTKYCMIAKRDSKQKEEHPDNSNSSLQH